MQKLQAHKVVTLASFTLVPHGQQYDSPDLWGMCLAPKVTAALGQSGDVCRLDLPAMQTSLRQCTSF